MFLIKTQENSDMRRFTSLFAFAICLCFISSAVFAQKAPVVIIDKAVDRNPTVMFKGVTGNPEMSAQVLSDLKNCGWFDVVTSGNAEYVISGTSSGNSVQLNVSGFGNYNVNASGTSVAATSHTAVDSILKQEFKIEGICRTKIVFSAETAPGKREIYMCDFDGSNIKKMTSNGALSIEPAWSPNGKSIIYSFVALSETSLVELNVANEKSRKLTQFTGINAGGKISPNGSKVALILSKDNQVDLYVRSVNGSDLVRLTKDKAVEASPCWSPDGSRICYVSDVSGRPALYVVSAGGGSPTRLTKGLEGESVTPAWNKDGRIAFTKKGAGYCLAIIDSKGGSSESSFGKEGKTIAGENPSWAPDNRHLVISHKGTIYIADTLRGRSRVLVSGKSKSSGANWSPILY